MDNDPKLSIKADGSAFNTTIKLDDLELSVSSVHFVYKAGESPSAVVHANMPEVELENVGSTLRFTTADATQYRCILEKALADMANVMRIQAEDPASNTDEYMRGMHNGMELIASTFMGREPQYKEAPVAE